VPPRNSFETIRRASRDRAEALYLEGRVYEQRATSNERVGSDTQSKMDLQSARAAYVKALQAPAEPRLVALIHSGVANVAYFQEDYTTANERMGGGIPRSIRLGSQGMGSLPHRHLASSGLAGSIRLTTASTGVRQQFPRSVSAERASPAFGRAGRLRASGRIHGYSECKQDRREPAIAGLSCRPRRWTVRPNRSARWAGLHLCRRQAASGQALGRVSDLDDRAVRVFSSFESISSKSGG